MKTFTIFLAVIFVVFFCTNSYSQFDGFNTYYYNYSSNLAYSNEMAESTAADTAGNFFVAGERSKETTVQDVHLIKYPQTGNSTSADYVNSTYREYVKKVLVKNAYVYVICNAVRIVDSKPTLCVLRYNINLTLLNTSFFVNANLSAPADACVDDSGHVFISCY